MRKTTKLNGDDRTDPDIYKIMMIFCYNAVDFFMKFIIILELFHFLTASRIADKVKEL